MAAGFEHELAAALQDFQRALDEGLAVGLRELAKRLANDPDYERPNEPRVIEVIVRRDQIADGAGSLYRGQFVDAGKRAALDGGRGEGGASVDLDPNTTHANMLRFVVLYGG